MLAIGNDRWEILYVRKIELYGGEDAPENLVLLCKMCHAEGPNVADPDVMWDWIRAYGVPLYDTFWQCKGMKEYKFIYKHSFGHALKYIMERSKVKMSNDELMDYIKQEIENVAHQSSVHYGQYYWNTMTYAGNYRRIIKSFAEQMGVNIKQMDEAIQEDDNIWWSDNML